MTKSTSPRNVAFSFQQRQQSIVFDFSKVELYLHWITVDYPVHDYPVHVTLKALRANIMFSVTYWMQGSIRQSRSHDDSLLRVFERYSVQCWSLNRENSDNLCTEVLRRAASPVLRG